MAEYTCNKIMEYIMQVPVSDEVFELDMVNFSRKEVWFSAKTEAYVPFFPNICTF